MTRLLLPVDGSPGSARAADHAARLARGLPGSTVLLLNVQSPVMASEISPYVTAEMVHRIHEKAGLAAVAGAREALRAAGVACEEHLLVGDPAQVIAEVAEEQGVDGVVMGTRGLGPVKNLVMGSVATKVVHLVRVPVTLVK